MTLNTSISEREENSRMISESAAAALADGVARARGLRFSSPGFDRAQWSEFAELGWLSLRLPEDRGGLGMGVSEYCALAQQLGRALVPEPLIGAIGALGMLPDAVLTEVVEGRRIVLPALSCSADSPTELRAGKLYGTAVHVPMAAGADAFLVRLDAGDYALIDASTDGLTMDCANTHDGGHLGTLHFDGAAAEQVSNDNPDTWEDATLATAAYLQGVAEASYELTLDFLKTRQQFGKPIGSYQALQHRMVDLYLELSLLRVSIAGATAAIDDGATGAARRAEVSRARARASRAADVICRQAVQLHGGIGYTDEADIGLFLRKNMTLQASFGGQSMHRRRFYNEKGVGQ